MTRKRIGTIMSVGLLSTVTMFFPGCHLFDDFDSLALKCPTNSAYPCRCDTDHNSGVCNDGSRCINTSETGSIGVCSKFCNGANDTVACVENNQFGLGGVCGLDEDENSVPDLCYVECDEEATQNRCPRGTECRKTYKYSIIGEARGCFPPDERTDSDQETDPECTCSQDEYACQNGDLQFCEDGCTWTTYDCERECISGGWEITTGCGHSSDLNHEICLCDYDEECDCQDGDFACDGDKINVCGDNCNWYSYSCEEVCADAGGYWGDCSYDEESGHDVCWCNGAKKSIPD